jgi:erythromycin esterase-like protein
VECDRLANEVANLNASFEIASEQYRNDLDTWQRDCAQHAQWQNDARDLLVKQDELISQLSAEIEVLKTERKPEEFRSQTAPTVDQASRESLLKMILGMALEQYAYEPSAYRSGATSNISSDLDSQGLSLDLKTIRKILKEAAFTHWEGERE